MNCQAVSCNESQLGLKSAVCNVQLLCPTDEGDGTATVDTDHDAVPDDCDNCQYEFNPLQTDSDGDLVGDACQFSSKSETL